MTTYSKGRRGRPWRRLRLEVLQANPVCSLCGGRIDLALPWRNPMSGTVDHVLPLMDYPHLALERSNLRPAHRRCNTSKGAGRSTRSALLTLGRRSRQW